jgi:hypothetical protein
MAGLIYYHIPYVLYEKQCGDPLCSFGCCHDFTFLKTIIEADLDCTFGKCQTQHKCKRYQCILHEDCNVYLKLRLTDNVVTAEMTAEPHGEKLLLPASGMHPYWIKEVDRLILENMSTKRAMIAIRELCLLPEMQELAALAPTSLQVQSRRKHVLTKLSNQSETSESSCNANKRTIYSDATVLFEGRFGKVIKRKNGLFEVAMAHTDATGTMRPVTELWEHAKVCTAVNACTAFFKNPTPLLTIDQHCVDNTRANLIPTTSNTTTNTQSLIVKQEMRFNNYNNHHHNQHINFSNNKNIIINEANAYRRHLLANDVNPHILQKRKHTDAYNNEMSEHDVINEDDNTTMNIYEIEKKSVLSNVNISQLIPLNENIMTTTTDSDEKNDY